VFVNKIDRPGAGDERVVQAISERLTTAVMPMGTTHAIGTRAAYFTLSSAEDTVFRARLAEVLAERDEAIMAAYVEGESHLPYHLLRDTLAAQTKRAVVHPVFFGSAVTGAGLDSLMTGISELLPASAGDPDGPVSGTVFKIERGTSGEKIAYVRMFSGTIHTRERLDFGRGLEEKVTAITVFERGPAAQRPAVSAGAVAKLWGLSKIQVGDRIGETGTDASDHHFSPPTLESVVVPGKLDDRARLRIALAQLAEQDPLIDVRQDDTRHELSVSLYGEVQKEVIQATLANEFGLEVTFRETTPIYIERPIGTGEAVELLHAESNPFLATIGLRIDPAPSDSGIDVRLQIAPRAVPLYLYKTVERFSERMGDYVRQTLREGLFGWQVTDCIVTMTKCIYSVPDGPPSRRGPLSTAADFRKLTPLVLMQALTRARTVVCEPIVRACVEIPTGAVGAVMAALARLDAAVEPASLQGPLSMIETVLSAARAQDLQRQLPGLTGGEGVLDSSFAGYQPVSGDQPTRWGRTTESVKG
jgi:ribosomal protection tetracycline resistance protein